MATVEPFNNEVKSVSRTQMKAHDYFKVLTFVLKIKYFPHFFIFSCKHTADSRK